MKKEIYEAPVLEVIEVAIESGFAATGDPDNFGNGGW
mgnify:CR=1 FL=1